MMIKVILVSAKRGVAIPLTNPITDMPQFYLLQIITNSHHYQKAKCHEKAFMASLLENWFECTWAVCTSGACVYSKV